MYRHILVGFNGTAGATRALHAALELARPGDGEVRVLCVAESPPSPPPVSGWELELERLGWDLCLGDWLARASAAGPPSSATPPASTAISWSSGGGQAGAGGTGAAGPPGTSAVGHPARS